MRDLENKEKIKKIKKIHQEFKEKNDTLKHE